MIKPFITVLLLITTFCVDAQTDVENLRETFGNEKADWLLENRPERAEYLAFWNIHGYYSADIPVEKDIPFAGDLQNVSAIYPHLPPLSDQLIESGELKLLGYDFGTSGEYRYYRMNNERMLVVLPPSLVKKLFDTRNTQ